MKWNNCKTAVFYFTRKTLRSLGMIRKYLTFSFRYETRIYVFLMTSLTKNDLIYFKRYSALQRKKKDKLCDLKKACIKSKFIQ